MTEIPLELLPRICPLCGGRTIIGHGQRLKHAHDQRHQQIWIRRGRCRPCHKTFTVLPDWSPPSGQYSFHCKQRAIAFALETGGIGRLNQPFRLAAIQPISQPDAVLGHTANRRYAGGQLQRDPSVIGPLRDQLSECTQAKFVVEA